MKLSALISYASLCDLRAKYKQGRLFFAPFLHVVRVSKNAGNLVYNLL